MNENKTDVRSQVEITVRQAVAEHTGSEEMQHFMHIYGEAALEEIINELIDEITSAKMKSE